MRAYRHQMGWPRAVWRGPVRVKAIRTAIALIATVAALVAYAASPAGSTPITDAPNGHNCRFWVCAADNIPAFVITDHLVALPNSIEQLSQANQNGWAVAYYSDGRGPIVRRGAPAAHLDPDFDSAVAEAAGASPRIAVSHIRACSSGICNIPNPHPFERQKQGRHWLMGHNGTISKEILLSLIRPEYLEANPPQYGSSYSDWIDSDLYFIYILQTAEDFGWDIKRALGEVVERLRDAIPGDNERINVFLTDGSTIWAYREGASLFYLYEPGARRQRPSPAGAASQEASWPAQPRQCGSPYSVAASQYPSASQGNWIELLDGELVTLTPTGPPTVELIDAYF